MKTETKPCGLCGSRESVPVFEKFGYRIVDCACCGLRYLDHSMTPAEIAAFYSTEYFKGGADRRGYADYVADGDSLRYSFRHKLAGIERLQAPGTILDIGCAAGFFLEEARERGWEVYGQEVSEFAGSVAAQLLGGERVFIGPLDAISLPAESVDVVTMWDVIEHLDSPREVLGAVRRLLKPGGVFVLCTGDIDSWLAKLQGRTSRIYNPPQHLYYYSRRTLSKLLDSSGFRVVDRRTERKKMTLRYIFYVLSSVQGDPVSRLAHGAVRGTPLGRLSVRVPLVDNMQVYAVKTS